MLASQNSLLISKHQVIDMNINTDAQSQDADVTSDPAFMSMEHSSPTNSSKSGRSDAQTQDSDVTSEPAFMSTEHSSRTNSSEWERPRYTVPRSVFSSGYKVLLIGFSYDLDGTSMFHGGSCERESNTSESSPDNFVATLPWGGNVAYYGRQGHTYLELPPFTKFVGIAKSLDDIDLHGSTLYEIPLQREYTAIGHTYPYFQWLTHIAVRKPQVQSVSRIVARRITMEGGNSTFGHICESGPSIRPSSITLVLDENNLDESNVTYAANTSIPDIILTSVDHRMVELGELQSSTVHPIPDIASNGEKIARIERFITNHRIKVRLWYVPIILVMSGICLWILPGLLQWLGGEDRNWASIVNQCIGTGSVLLSVVIYISRTFFFHRGTRRTMAGKMELQNDFAARLLAPGLVRQLEAVVCDPRLPSYLVTDDCSSAVRNRQTFGWLQIGLSIPVSEMEKHGYHVLMDKGVVLDLLQAKIYKLETTESGDERILRSSFNIQWKQHSVDRNAKIV